MRLLCIANPAAYRKASTDVPESYARLAAHPELELFHAETDAVLGSGDAIPVAPVPAGFGVEDFATLPAAATVLARPAEFDWVFCRTLKPFPPGYLERLGAWAEAVPFVNDPRGIRRQLDPGFLLEAARSFLPPTCLTRRAGEAERFFRRWGTIVAKRANSCGGREVYKLSGAADGGLATDNVVEGERRFGEFGAAFAHALGPDARPLLLMRYLPRVLEGDRRLIAVGGEILGAYLRQSSAGHWVQNVSFGARCIPSDVTAADAAVVAATAPVYARAGIHVLGYDLLRDDDGEWRVSEINAGNVGGLARLERLGAPGATERLVAWLAGGAAAAAGSGAASC